MRAEDGPWTASRLARLDPFDVVNRHSRDLARAKVYPAVDVVMSRSSLFQTNAVSAEHVVVAERVRKAIAALWAADLNAENRADALMLERALKLQNYFTQPFFVAERWTKCPGTTVPLADSLQTCRDILDGRYDDLPTEAFYFSGDMTEIRGNVGRVLSFGPVTPPWAIP
jgi:F0F1-type ATP synthase beta subunit